MFFKYHAPRLYIHQPTAATISFTVSTRPTRRSLTARLVYLLSHILRVIVGIAIITLTWIKWRTMGLRAEGSSKSLASWELRVISSLLGQNLYQVAQMVQWRWMIPAAILGIFAVVRRGYVEESLLVLRDLGIQTSSSTPTYLTGANTRFIPSTAIQDIFIHEAFKGFEVRYYLGIVVEGEEDVVVVFPKFLPRRKMLEHVWRGARACLYESK